MDPLSKARRKLSKSLRVNGLWGTVKLIASQPVMLRRNKKSNARRNQAQTEFDKKYGTDTGGVVSLSDFEIDSPNWIHGGRYGPTSPERFRECLSLLPVSESEYGRFVFIDLGSGKGATLLYASDLNFKSVIGIEFVKALHEVAEANILKYPSCPNKAKSICCDATEYEFPDEALIVFASNPFGGELMDSVLQNMARNRHANYFIHENAVYPMLDLPSAGFLKLLASDSACKAYGTG